MSLMGCDRPASVIPLEGECRRQETSWQSRAVRSPSVSTGKGNHMQTNTAIYVVEIQTKYGDRAVAFRSASRVEAENEWRDAVAPRGAMIRLLACTGLSSETLLVREVGAR
jgi:hypothetical protein